MTLDEIALKCDTDKSSDPQIGHDYCRVYERLFEPLRSERFDLLEIGTLNGGSVRLWLEAFPQATIYGVDIARQDQISDPRYVFCQGDQSKPEFWDKFKAPEALRIVIDDGSHYAAHVLASFDRLWPSLQPGGFYVVEDIFCWFFYDIWDLENRGKAFLSQLLGAVNLNGKYFYGNPGTVPPDQPLTLLEKELESVQVWKGLLILKKRSAPPNLL